MSSMLEQAIIEAEQLKKVASRNAEQAILEKYSKEIKGEMESLIEQELGLDASLEGLGDSPASTPSVDFEGAKTDNDNIPSQLEYAAFDGITIGETKYPEEGDLIEINLDSLSEYELNPEAGPTTRDLSESIEIDDTLLEKFINEELDEEMLVTKKKDDKKKDDKKKDDDDKTESHCGTGRHEEAMDAMKFIPVEETVEEGIKVDYNSVKEGNPFGTIDERDEMNLILAALKEECEALNMKNESLSDKNNKLVNESTEYKKNFESAINTAKDLNNKYASLLEKFQDLKGAFEESQLMNAKLVYTNKVLSDDKLNIRQKNKIAESIQGSESVDKAKIVYETLVNAVESTSKKGPESLSEAVTRRKHPLFVKRNQEGRKPSNDFADRMMRLAGIDK
jgi:FtsZ-binding cell division protein ZapB